MEKKAGNAEGEVSALRSRLILLQVGNIIFVNMVVMMIIQLWLWWFGEDDGVGSRDVSRPRLQVGMMKLYHRQENNEKQEDRLAKATLELAGACQRADGAVGGDGGDNDLQLDEYDHDDRDDDTNDNNYNDRSLLKQHLSFSEGQS